MLVKKSLSGSFPFFMPDETDPWSGKAGLNTGLITVEYLRTNDTGFSFVTNPTITELGGGWYRYNYSASEVSVNGPVIFRFTAAGAKTQQVMLQVVGFDPNDANGLGLSRLDTNIGSRAASGDAMTLTAAERSSIASSVWSHVIEGTHTALKFMQWMGAVLFGKRDVSGSRRTYYGMDATTVRVDGNVDSSGNRVITSRS